MGPGIILFHIYEEDLYGTGTYLLVVISELFYERPELSSLGRTGRLPGCPGSVPRTTLRRKCTAASLSQRELKLDVINGHYGKKRCNSRRR